jgi:cyanophycinase
VICLQGGAEFGALCRDMDRDLLSRADGGPVVVTALAGAQGREYRTAGDNGVRHFRELGAKDVTVAPDVRADPEGALAALRTARLLVLPGGSPSRLLDALRSTAVGELLAERLAAGAVVMGSSAGAMVLCAWTVLPDRSGPSGGPAVEPGLGLVPDLLVLPHWSGPEGREPWLQAVDRAVPPGVQVVGLPEQSGVLVEDGALTAVGSTPTALLTDGSELQPGATRRLP